MHELAILVPYKAGTFVAHVWKCTMDQIGDGWRGGGGGTLKEIRGQLNEISQTQNLLVLAMYDQSKQQKAPLREYGTGDYSFLAPLACISASVTGTSSVLICSGALASLPFLMPLAPGVRYVLSRAGSSSPGVGCQFLLFQGVTCKMYIVSISSSVRPCDSQTKK